MGNIHKVTKEVLLWLIPLSNQSEKAKVSDGSSHWSENMLLVYCSSHTESFMSPVGICVTDSQDESIINFSSYHLSVVESVASRSDHTHPNTVSHCSIKRERP